MKQSGCLECPARRFSGKNTPLEGRMNETDRDERFRVWDALSQFFLDTELDRLDYEYISDVLADSPFSLTELRDILYYEVYPPCKWNLFCVAGLWTGFHPDWIMAHIAPRKDKRSFWRLGPFHKWMFRDHWIEVAALVQRKRNTPNKV